MPIVDVPGEIAGRSCEESLEKARQLAKSPALDRARLAYLWLVTHCDTSPVLPQAMLEAGSLLAYMLHQPGEAHQVYEDVLRRFPADAEAADATYHLAKIEIDAGDYTAAVAHLTLLAHDYPNGPHQESAKFLAVKAAEMLAAHKESRRTLPGRLASVVPNNLFSLLALLAAIGPAAIHALKTAKGEAERVNARSRWAMPTIIIGLTLVNYVINNFQTSRQNTLLMERLDQLMAARAQSHQD